MEVQIWPVTRPIPYARNARKISQEAIDKCAASIKQFGWRVPIVCNREDVILAGHTRLLAAQKLGLAEVPVHVVEDLSKADEMAFRLAENRSHDEAKWDYELVALELKELRDDFDYDLSLTAFDGHEIDPLLAADWTPPPVSDEEHSTGGGDKDAPQSITFTMEQYETVIRAINLLRNEEQDTKISEGRACELICGDFLSEHLANARQQANA